MNSPIWETKHKFKDKKVKTQDIVEVLLKNRGITSETDRKDFFEPPHPLDISLKNLGISVANVKKAVARIKKAQESKEKVIVFGDYDADGICSSAILWEILYSLKCDVIPYIPNRFSEGYGIKKESLRELKKLYPSLGLIVTVDNGIVAFEAVKEAKKIGIDIIIVDHHEVGEEYPEAYSVIHSTKICGSAITWIFAREIAKDTNDQKYLEKVTQDLSLACIGTISDQMSLTHENRSFVFHGLSALRKTNRLGLRTLFEEAGLDPETIGTYEIGFVLAPRLNATGRMGHAIESLRLICTKDKIRSKELAKLLGQTNTERQKLVEEIVLHANTEADNLTTSGVLILSHSTYHEGIIGLAASKMVERFGRPSIVISVGERHSKGSARSISGVNIIEIIRSQSHLLVEAGGHEMAAGFTIETAKIEEFRKTVEELTSKVFTPELLTKKLVIDTELELENLTWELVDEITKFEPFGPGNLTPSFLTSNISVLDARVVGTNGKHLKLKVGKQSYIFEAIAFGMGEKMPHIKDNSIDLAYNLESNFWNGSKSLQLKVKDMKINE